MWSLGFIRGFWGCDTPCRGFRTSRGGITASAGFTGGLEEDGARFVRVEGRRELPGVALHEVFNACTVVIYQEDNERDVMGYAVNAVRVRELLLGAVNQRSHRAQPHLEGVIAFKVFKDNRGDGGVLELLGESFQLFAGDVRFDGLAVLVVCVALDANNEVTLRGGHGVKPFSRTVRCVWGATP